jgi:hypothetical protein
LHYSSIQGYKNNVFDQAEPQPTVFILQCVKTGYWTGLEITKGPCAQKHATIILDQIHIATTATTYNRNHYKIHTAGICKLYRRNNNTGKKFILNY